MIEDLTESFIPVCNTITGTPTILILTNFFQNAQVMSKTQYGSFFLILYAFYLCL